MTDYVIDGLKEQKHYLFNRSTWGFQDIRNKISYQNATQGTVYSAYDEEDLRTIKVFGAKVIEFEKSSGLFFNFRIPTEEEVKPQLEAFNSTLGFTSGRIRNSIKAWVRKEMSYSDFLSRVRYLLRIMGVDVVRKNKYTVLTIGEGKEIFLSPGDSVQLKNPQAQPKIEYRYHYLYRQERASTRAEGSRQHRQTFWDGIPGDLPLSAIDIPSVMNASTPGYNYTTSTTMWNTGTISTSPLTWNSPTSGDMIWRNADRSQELRDEVIRQNAEHQRMRELAEQYNQILVDTIQLNEPARSVSPRRDRPFYRRDRY